MSLTEGQAKSIFEKLEVTGEQGDATDKQFVFPRQCVVLGDSRVGKTSLVKSLTGKPFDPTQQKTQGIDQCLVDNEWKNCNLKDLVFGDLWKFLKTGDVEVALTGNGSANSPVVARKFKLITGFYRLFIYLYVLTITTMVLIGTIYDLPLSVLIFYYVHYVPLLFRCCAFQFEGNLRFILATFVFILSRRGLIVGLYLGLVFSHLDETFIRFASSRNLLGTVAGISFVTLFLCIGPLQLPFGTGPLVKNQTFIVILCFYRLPVSILIGLFFGFVVATSFRSLQENCSRERSFEMISACLQHVGTIIYNTSSIFIWDIPLLHTKIFRNILLSVQEETSLGTFVTLVSIMLFYHCKLAFTSPEIYFAMLFPLYFCLTVYREWFCIFSKSNDKEHMYFRTSYMTLALMGNGEMNTKILRRALKKKFPSLKLKILDFAGDKEYYAYHHMFLRREDIYVVVFNIAKLIENNFRNIKESTERLQFWLESVCSHVPPKAPIFLVGTHRGEMTQICMKTLNGHLVEHLWDLYEDELVVNDVDKLRLVFFPVENSKGENDAGVQILRTKIMSLAEERQKVTAYNIPLSWITIQDAIINLRGNKKAKFCVTLEEFPTALGNFICTNWSEETLKHFHEKGLVIYLYKDPKLSNWVLLKPEILVDIIIKLVTPPPQMIQKKGFRRDWKLLHDKGILTKSLLTRIISTVQENEEAMTAFLEEYDLICPLSNKKVNIRSSRDDEALKSTHFVPSLLPKYGDGCIPVWRDKTTDKKFYVFFKRFLPEPLFHRLLSRAHKNSKLEFPNGSVVMFKDVGKFWMSPKQPIRVPYRLKLMKEEAIIEVTFSSR